MPWWPLPSSDVAVLIARIEEVLRVQRELAETLVLTNADVRTRRLGQIALGDVNDGRTEATDALGKSGAIALPEIQQIKPKFVNEQSSCTA
jgi:predicted transcriptional regulator